VLQPLLFLFFTTFNDMNGWAPRHPDGGPGQDRRDPAGGGGGARRGGKVAVTWGSGPEMPEMSEWRVPVTDFFPRRGIPLLARRNRWYHAQVLNIWRVGTSKVAGNGRS
jgi:hypothetical protein